MTLEELKKKKVLILGFGKEGRDAFRFLRRLFPSKILGIADISSKLSLSGLPPGCRPPKAAQGQAPSSKLQAPIKWHLGENYLKALKDYDVIIKSPGVPIHLSEVEAAFKQKKITSATEIFFEHCPGIIIGITGTKGKGTTAALIYEILKQAGFKVKLVGNIGKPCLSYLTNLTDGSNWTNGIFVYELSSHQLSNLKKSPHMAVFLNIWPEHLDYYRNFREYERAKANVACYQKKEDWLIYNSANKTIREIAKKSKAKKLAFNQVRVGERILKKFPLPGKHNLLNLKAALVVAKIFGVKEKAIEKAVKNFKPLRHRLELVGHYGGIKFYDDSAATTPEATIAAIKTLGEELQTIILGGSDKASDYRDLAKKICQSKIKNVLLFPTTGEKILLEINNLCPRSHYSTPAIRYFFVKNMKEAVALSYQHTDQGKICLLSPASASFTLFRNYKQRGDLFKKYVKSKCHI